MGTWENVENKSKMYSNLKCLKYEIGNCTIFYNLFLFLILSTMATEYELNRHYINAAVSIFLVMTMEFSVTLKKEEMCISRNSCVFFSGC